MGTNFSLFTKDREKRKQWFSEIETYDCLTDSPDFGYKFHIAKTSCGWRPLFEKHSRINSVRDIKSAVENGFQIVDEYGTFYTWAEFEERVVKFAEDRPDAISHLDYEGGRYRNEYYKDPDGCEFSKRPFS